MSEAEIYKCVSTGRKGAGRRNPEKTFGPAAALWEGNIVSGHRPPMCVLYVSPHADATALSTDGWRPVELRRRPLQRGLMTSPTLLVAPRIPCVDATRLSQQPKPTREAKPPQLTSQLREPEIGR